MGKKICDGEMTPIWVDAGRHRDPNMGWTNIFRFSPKGVKRIRLTCPKCGRRIMSSIILEHDGFDIIHSLPPHKPKGWWKKNGKNRKKSTSTQIYRSTKR